MTTPTTEAVRRLLELCYGAPVPSPAAMQALVNAIEDEARADLAARLGAAAYAMRCDSHRPRAERVDGDAETTCGCCLWLDVEEAKRDLQR